MSSHYSRFIRMSDLKQKVGLSRSKIYRLIQQREFPGPIKIGSKVSVWIDTEVEEWMSRQMPTRQ